jgi:hypothetical protein
MGVMEFAFTFVISGATVDDEPIVTLLFEELDATLARAGNVDLLALMMAGSDAIDAARNVVLKVKFFVPQIQFLRLDRDLVGVSEIAQRTRRTRQNVAQWVNGERRSEPMTSFPEPEAVVGRKRIWLWADVNAWLRQLGLSDEVGVPTRSDMVDIDYMLQHNILLTLERPRVDIGWPSMIFSPMLLAVGTATSDSWLRSSSGYQSAQLTYNAHYHSPERLTILTSSTFVPTEAGE